MLALTHRPLPFLFSLPLRYHIPRYHVPRAAMAGGRSKKDGKVLKPCVGSRFTWGSMHSALKDVSRLAGVKSELWSRVLGVIVGSEAQDDEWAALLEELRGAVTAAAIMEASTSVRITAEKCGVELESACEAKYGVSFTRAW